MISQAAHHLFAHTHTLPGLTSPRPMSSSVVSPVTAAAAAAAAVPAVGAASVPAPDVAPRRAAAPPRLPAATVLAVAAQRRERRLQLLGLPKGVNAGGAIRGCRTTSGSGAPPAMQLGATSTGGDGREGEASVRRALRKVTQHALTIQ
jgi:hypothetical protein